MSTSVGAVVFRSPQTGSEYRVVAVLPLQGGVAVRPLDGGQYRVRVMASRTTLARFLDRARTRGWGWGATLGDRDDPAHVSRVVNEDCLSSVVGEAVVEMAALLLDEEGDE